MKTLQEAQRGAAINVRNAVDNLNSTLRNAAELGLYLEVDVGGRDKIAPAPGYITELNHWGCYVPRVEVTVRADV